MDYHFQGVADCTLDPNDARFIRPNPYPFMPAWGPVKTSIGNCFINSPFDSGAAKETITPDFEECKNYNRDENEQAYLACNICHKKIHMYADPNVQFPEIGQERGGQKNVCFGR